MRRLIVIVFLALMATTVGAASAQSGQRIHVVAPGESLYGISLWYGVSVGLIADANGIIDTNQIYAGQRLIIPSGRSSYRPAPPPVYNPPPVSNGRVYYVRPGDSLAGIAALYHSSVSALSAANGIYNSNLIYVGQPLQIPYVPQVYSYTIAYGDTLGIIAARYGTTVAAIASYNGISNPSLIYPGMLIRVPV